MSAPRFNSVLVANRGEIACRIIRSAKANGYRTLAVYSEADKNALHTKLADQAVLIGPAPASQSYLVIDKIIAAAKESGAQAIHPGYGFLSENAAFASACTEAGIVFIGPSANAIELMGNKAAAKQHMINAGVPCVPGYQGNQDESSLVSAGGEIGVPLMVKAAAGGGGRGMRLVSDESELLDAIKLARTEAESAFGSGELILEKAILEPRHVEVQVFGDEQGNIVHMGERDCSVQRRHQKVIEESPCPVMTPALREQMGAAAVAAAQSIDYVGAGTVEFLLDADGQYYFLEMNTRLQVEHPVTEMVTGLDLVTLQLQVAQGRAIGMAQNDIALSGHAIEVRLYSEDPNNDFMPSAGRISLWQPSNADGVRFDDGIVSGDDVSPFYDPMLAKVIAYGPDREEARRKLLSALQSTALFGVANNKQFLVSCLGKPSFVRGAATTAFIEQEFGQQVSLGSRGSRQAVPSLSKCAIAAVLDLQRCFEQCLDTSVSVVPGLQHWSSASPLVCRRRYEFGQTVFDLELLNKNGLFSVHDLSSGDTVRVELQSWSEHKASLSVGGERHAVSYLWQRNGEITLGFSDADIYFADQNQLGAATDAEQSDGQVSAPMHGMIAAVMVSAGQTVVKGEKLAVLEAMKMQHEILAPIDGQISELNVDAGKQVAADDQILTINPTD